MQKRERRKKKKKEEERKEEEEFEAGERNVLNVGHCSLVGQHVTEDLVDAGVSAGDIAGAGAAILGGGGSRDPKLSQAGGPQVDAIGTIGDTGYRTLIFGPPGCAAGKDLQTALNGKEMLGIEELPGFRACREGGAQVFRSGLQNFRHRAVAHPLLE